jgi:hypothetical protein
MFAGASEDPMKWKIASIQLLSTWLLLGTTSLALAQLEQPSDGAVTICVKGNGQLRMLIRGETACQPGERQMEWDVGENSCGHCGSNLCRQDCERGILRLHYTVTDDRGNETCPDAPTLVLHCDPYTCDPEGHGCRAVCQADSECSGGYVCDDTHLPQIGQCLPYVFTCSGGDTLQAPNGDEISCFPYRCEGNHCKGHCTSKLDCSEGQSCTAEGHCAPPPS